MFNYLKTIAMVALVAGSFVTTRVEAAWLGLPMTFKNQVDKIMLAKPVLAPFAFSRFCVHYSDECQVHGNVFRRPKAVILTEQRQRDIVEVNRTINHQIIPARYTKADFYDSWSIAPTQGDCNDFAVTKRHELLSRGWPSRALLLAEVVTSWGEHHMILVVRTRDRDMVLDNLTPQIRAWSQAPYKWVRVQSPGDPAIWSTVVRNA